MTTAQLAAMIPLATPPTRTTVTPDKRGGYTGIVEWVHTHMQKGYPIATTTVIWRPSAGTATLVNESAAGTSRKTVTIPHPPLHPKAQPGVVLARIKQAFQEGS
jgi:hypothetical protein